MEKRLLWIDTLRVLACFGVVLLHSGAGLLYEWGSIPDSHWLAANIYGNAVRCRIPVFLMISGAVILPKVYGSLGDYLGRRVMRLVWPYLFWSAVYLPFIVYLMHRVGDPVSLHTVWEVFTGRSTYMTEHLWYIWVILGLNLFFPVLGRWIRSAGEGEIRYFIALWLVAMVVAIPAVADVVPPIDLRHFAGYVGYTVVGYHIATRQWTNPRLARRVGAALTVAGGVAIVGVTWIVTQARGELWSKLLGNLNPLVATMGAGAFLWFRNLDLSGVGPRTVGAIRFVSRYSYGIYLVHILVHTALGHFGIYHSMIHPALGIPVSAVACFAISLTAVWVVNKIPRIGKYISG